MNPFPQDHQPCQLPLNSVTLYFHTTGTLPPPNPEFALIPNSSAPSLANGSAPSLANGSAPSFANGSTPCLANGSAPSLASSVAPPLTHSSHYTFGSNLINGETHIRAADARAQVQAAPPPRRPYPSRFANHIQRNGKPELPIPFSQPYQHTPLIPNQSTPYQSGESPGALRAMYQDQDRSNMFVARHDKTAGVTEKGHGKFVECNYHPSVPRN